MAFSAAAQTVKVTPLGGIDGEFCPQDRAIVFEDPNGMRILYDPGRTVALDWAALLGERAAIAGLTRGGQLSTGGACRLLHAVDEAVRAGVP